MEAKLTLRMNSTTISRAKSYARQHHTSISKMVQSYLDAMTFAANEEAEITPLVRSLSGVVNIQQEKSQ